MLNNERAIVRTSHPLLPIQQQRSKAHANGNSTMFLNDIFLF
jgi:hypothetical protein